MVTIQQRLEEFNERTASIDLTDDQRRWLTIAVETILREERHTYDEPRCIPLPATALPRIVVGCGDD